MRVVAVGVFLELFLASPAHAAQPDARRVLRSAEIAMGRIGGPADIKMTGRVQAEGRTGNHEEVIRPGDGIFVT